MRIRGLFPLLLLLPSAAEAQASDMVVQGLPELAGGASLATHIVRRDDGGWRITGASTDGDPPFGVVQAVAWDLVDTSLPADLIPAPSLDPTKDCWGHESVVDGLDYLIWTTGVVTDPLDQRLPALWTQTLPDTEFSLPVPFPVLAGGEGQALSFMYSLDRLGVVGSSNNGSVDRAVYWNVPLQAGSPTVTPLPDGGVGTTSEATNIVQHRAGLLVACGWGTTSQGDTLPRFWKSSDGGVQWTMKVLPPFPGGGWGVANGIITGDSVQVELVGASETPGGSRRALLWRSVDEGENWTRIGLGAADGLANSTALAGVIDVNSDSARYIVGSSDESGTEVATFWVLGREGWITAQNMNALAGGTSPYLLLRATSVCLGDVGVFICGAGATQGEGSLTTSNHVFDGEHAWVAETQAVVAVEPEASSPSEIQLIQASPNPFVGGTTIFYELPRAGKYRLTLYDALGRRIATLGAGTREPGRYAVSWNGRTDWGHEAKPGQYFVRLDLDGRTVSKAIVLLQ